MKNYIVIVSVIICIVIFLFVRFEDQILKQGDSNAINISKVMSGEGVDSRFKRALDPVEFSFPRDHGSHPDYQTEWWYFTGNLRDEKNNRFGYQLTFFRRGLAPGEKKDDSSWRANQIYFAHFALTDGTRTKYYSYEKWSREMPALAGATGDDLQVWIDDWSVEPVSSGTYLLKSSGGNISISLDLKPEKPVVLNGDKGLSKKSYDPGNASYYYSFSRMKTTGQILIEGVSHEVAGTSWFDHEWSTSALGKEQRGWDWFAIQFDNNTELMIYQLRLNDGSIDAVSSGTYNDKDGNTYHLKRSDFKVTVTDYWTSPKSESKYPSYWKIKVPRFGLNFDVQPLVDNQEFNHSFKYWEGAVKAKGEKINGSGYVELTGY